MKAPRGITNEQGYQNYRGLVEMDIKGWTPFTAPGGEGQERRPERELAALTQGLLPI